MSHPRYIPTGEWILCTNTFTDISPKDLFKRPFTGRPVFVFHSQEGATTVVQALYSSLSLQPWMSGWTTALEPYEPDSSGGSNGFAVYKMVGESVGEEGDVKDLVYGRLWWVLFVTGNRVMEKGIFDAKYRDADWDKERAYDRRNEQDNALVMKWFIEEVRRDVSELTRSAVRGA
ncbi:uncharacterized protein K460DRAFT_351754 [Cucurbitaria berberidis CBS 394.84]|uniref:Uncharacterized protein n=1 Tax=Cucurbitaria berberidis CBS 394.84 TaxID=1168544 RepID=A0A9P4LEB8_9PLEO|nr:uncharacterized protein K460DRAFT_351754 [Cucurbitaria berberidis CBS 394.84]KAF1851885.1 hypothetical protein K460DRAFT_351754 [Cucurbitaria berberidis CBS 394.84]